MQIKNRQQILTIGAIAVIALFAGDKLLFTPLTHAWSARKDKIAELHKQVEQGKALLQREQVVRTHWDQIRKGTLPTDPSSAEQKFFEAIDRWRQDSLVNLNGTTPQWKHDSDDFMTYQCRIDASGSLAALSRFLYDIERDDQLALKLESVELTARDKEGKQLVLALQVSGLVLTPQTR
jgi:hypothetical protein